MRNVTDRVSWEIAAVQIFGLKDVRFEARRKRHSGDFCFGDVETSGYNELLCTRLT
jgi:hypothetical protein